MGLWTLYYTSHEEIFHRYIVGKFYASSLWEASNFYSITAMVTILLFM